MNEKLDLYKVRGVYLGLWAFNIVSKNMSIGNWPKYVKMQTTYL